jgi:hypothetical protein
MMCENTGGIIELELGKSVVIASSTSFHAGLASIAVIACICSHFAWRSCCVSTSSNH